MSEQESALTRDEYLTRHHEISETAIGLARIHLSRGDSAKAMAALDEFCDQLDTIHRRRMASIEKDSVRGE